MYPFSKFPAMLPSLWKCWKSYIMMEQFPLRSFLRAWEASHHDPKPCWRSDFPFLWLTLLAVRWRKWYTQPRLAQFCSTSNSYKTFTFQYTVSSCERLLLVVLCHHTGLNVIDESAILLLIEWGFQDWKHPSECWNLDHSHEKWQKMLAILFQEKTKKKCSFSQKMPKKNASTIEKGRPIASNNSALVVLMPVHASVACHVVIFPSIYAGVTVP